MADNAAHHGRLSWITNLDNELKSKSRLIILLFLLYHPWVLAGEDQNNSCLKSPKLFKPVCQGLHQIWFEGKNEVFIPSYAWHNRYYYSREKIGNYNENPWGLGFGKSFYDEHHNWHSLYAMAFLDSHKNVEPFVGYAFAKIIPLGEYASIGPGLTLGLTSRPDILHSIPFPGVLPLVSMTYRRASMTFIYIPGSHNIGNVLFIVARWVLN